jgi:hypothetical protein
MKTNPLLQWRQLAQSNRTASAQVLALAQKLGVPDADRWAAAVLAQAQRGAEPFNVADPKQLLQAAEVAALGQQLATPNAPAVLSLQRIRQLATERAQPAPAVATPIAVNAPMRSAEAARTAFNHPDHWRDAGAGKVAPNVARLEGTSALAWQDLTQKFGAPLATALFDIKARGSSVTSLIQALEKSGSKLSLTPRDLAHLQYVCFTDGRVKEGVALLTLHDAFHTYGTSVFEEMYGDAHTEGLVRSLFAGTASSKIAVNPNLPLSAQPLVVAQLKERIKTDFASVAPGNLTYEIRENFYQTDDFGYESFKHDWYASPSSNPQQLEKIVNASGAFANLDAATRTQITALIYDKNDPNSFASISRELEARMAAKPYAAGFWPPTFTAWLSRLNAVVEKGLASRMLNEGQFTEQAAQAIALSLAMERAAPGSLARGPSSTLLDDTSLARPLHTLNLRSAYPDALREVRQALGLTP